MAANIMKSVAAKQKRKGFMSKSAKDKQRNVPPQTPVDHTISRPSTTVGGDGLYIKLTTHQKNISAHIQFITVALENGHKKMELSTIITQLLVQLDCVVTTTHQCLTREVFDKDSSLKPRLDQSERTMYANMAVLVRWVDLGSKERQYPQDTERIRDCIGTFEKALLDIVKLVAESQTALSQSESQTLRRIRRASVDGGVVHGVASSPSETIHPQLAALKAEGKDRKTSWTPGMTPGKHKNLSPHAGVLRDSLQSDHSSASDEEKRRSGSAERTLHHSPEHSRHVSASPEWDSRGRSNTAPVDPSTLRVPLPISTTTPTLPIPIPPSSPKYVGKLPPLPGEIVDSPPPPIPPRNQEELVPPLPPRKGHTLPRISDGPYLNGRLSPELPPPSQSEEPEKPPPLPVKQRKRHQAVQMNGHAHPPRPDPYDIIPPPLPMKKRTVSSKSSMVSPTHSPTRTPTHTPTHTPMHTPMHSYSRSADYDDVTSRPPVPVRMESIPAVKLALETQSQTPPRKPPRTDRPVHIDLPSAAQSHQDNLASIIKAVRDYNMDIMKGISDPDAKPPIPLKKKTVMRYKELLHGYHFEDVHLQPLYIPGMAEPPPPPVPPKKRTRRRVPQVGSSVEAGSRGSPSKESSPQKQDASLNSELSASSEDVFNDEMDVDDREVNYLECEETSGYLIFHKEDGGYTLRGGPVDALIAYAASTTNAVKHFSEAFLLTYYTFITPEELIGKLLYRLDFFYKLGNAAVWTATTSLLVRVLNGLNQPLVKEAEIKLIDMVHQMLSDGNLKFAQLLRNSLVTKLNQLIPDRKQAIPLGKAFQSNSLSFSRKLSILDFKPDEVAEQMTLLDNELFQKVDVAEMLYWAAEQNEEKSPQLTQFTMHFNNVSQWTKTRLLERSLDMKVRIKLMLHFIAIMKSLRERYNNFNSYLAILSAVESSPISRLDWPDRVIKGLEDPRALIDNRGSFKNYREAFAHAKPPCIPYIGLYLQDLTFIEMQPSTLEGASLNFTKRWKQFKSVDHIRFAQTKQYSIVPDPDILGLFNNFEVPESDEDLWAISVEIKPSARALRTLQQQQQAA